MRRAVAHSLLSLLLLATLVWGGCISCERYFMWPAAKSCCTPGGACKTKAPVERSCLQIPFDHQKVFDLAIDLPVIAEIPRVAALPAAENRRDRRSPDAIEPSPPDLQVLHSTFLI